MIGYAWLLGRKGEVQRTSVFGAGCSEYLCCSNSVHEILLSPEYAFAFLAGDFASASVDTLRGIPAAFPKLLVEVEMFASD